MPSLTKDVLLLINWVEGEPEVLAWNIHTKGEIFSKKFPAGVVKFDQHNKQVGRNTRLQITGTTVTDTSQTPLPGDLDLVEFSHPLYLTRVGGDFTLWKLGGTGFTRVGDLGRIGANTVGSPMFCPARDSLVMCSYDPLRRMRLRVFSTITGQITVDRRLTLPTSTDIALWSRVVVSVNQLVVEAMITGLGFDEPAPAVLLVYQVDSLLSNAADQEINPRRFETSEPAFSSPDLYLTNTSVTAGLQGRDTVKFSALDFWNTEN